MSEGSPAVVLTAQDLNVAIRARPADLQRILNKIQGRGQAASVQKKQTILRDVTIKIPGPSLTAIIGPSGCGKTTLLDALSGRRRNDALLEYSGRTSIVGDGHNYATTRSGSASGLDVAYARQEDNLFPMLTVRETLEYAATLNSHQSQRSERGDAVGDVIHSLGLDRCADSRIGDPQHKGCSGGEIRRTSIGIQILKRQPILFLDEPTTGLDSKAALDLLHVLCRLVDNGTTVVVTLHQPRSEAWAEIDNLVVMSQGTVLYAGNSQHSLGHFAKGGWSVNAFDNPFDFISDLIAVDTRSESAEETSRARVMGLRELWISTPLVDNHMHFRQSLAISPCPGYDRQEGNRFWKLLLTHCHRTLRMTLRDRLGVVASLLEGLCMGLACGLIFYQLDGDLPGIRSRQGALYCTSSMQSYLVLLYETYRLTADLPAYDRELEDGVVTPATFYLSRRLTRFAIEDITTPLIFSIAFYFMAGLRAGASEFFLYYLVQLLLHLISVNVATCCAATTRGFIRAGLLANLNYVVQCLCAGLFINPGSLAPWVGWIRWGTHLRYAFGALCSNEFSRNSFACPSRGSAVESGCQEYDGDFIMQSLGFPTPWLTTPLAAMLGFWLMFSALAVGVLYLPPKAPSLVPQLKHTETTHDPVRPALPVRTCRDLTLESVSVSYLYTNLLRPGSSKLVFGPVSARFEPGTLTAILGPSGSGKTTLLQAVTGRLRGGFRTRFVRTGHIQVHGRQARESDMRSTCAFVPQSDHGLLHYLTVRETLQYAARLRLPANLEEEDVSAHAESVLSELGLTPCADTIVGNSRIRGISGGEKRRLSIAVQILANPAVLVLDEPTSGLDAFTAMTVMQTLRSLASQGRTVITVVHQPRWAFMETCDKILMLSHNGGQAFFGSADELTVQLEVDRETSLPTANPADLALDRLAESHKTCSNSAVPTWTWTAGAGNSKQEGLPMSIRVVSSRSRPTSVPVATSHISSYPKNRCTPGFSTVLWILMQRSLVKCRRAPRLFLSRIMQIVGAGMIVVLFFTPLGHDSAAAQTRVGIIAQSSSLFFVGMLNAIAIYPSDLDLFLQEFGDSLYGAEAFLTSYTLIELPLEMLGASLLSLLVVFATKLSERFEVYLVIAYTSFAIINCGESLGIMFLSFIEHTALALSVMSVVLSTCTALNGAFSLDMLSWIGALNSLSPSKWQVQAALSSSLRGVKFSCDDTELLDHGECPVSSGDQLLELYNMDVPTAKAACILAAVTIGYRLLAYIALKIRCRISTRG